MYYLKCLPRNTTPILVEREKDYYHLKERNGKSLRSFLFMTKKLKKHGRQDLQRF